MTRREFVIASTTAMCTIAAAPSVGAACGRPPFVGRTDAQLLEGDPYTAHVDDHGLGGGSWDAAYEHALRFRATPEDRDRYVLGLEV